MDAIMKKILKLLENPKIEINSNADSIHASK